jgi:hypothetical protein
VPGGCKSTRLVIARGFGDAALEANLVEPVRRTHCAPLRQDVALPLLSMHRD